MPENEVERILSDLSNRQSFTKEDREDLNGIILKLLLEIKSAVKAKKDFKDLIKLATPQNINLIDSFIENLDKLSYSLFMVNQELEKINNNLINKG